jgi:hypothetical protein
MHVALAEGLTFREACKSAKQLTAGIDLRTYKDNFGDNRRLFRELLPF